MKSSRPTKTSNQYHREAPRRRVRTGSDQPLKPFTVSWQYWTFFIVAGALLTVLMVRNYDTVSWYLNRPVNTVRIESPLQQITEGEVKTLLAAYMGEGFFNINVTSIRERLETHPWIARAAVKRVWPNSLVLGLTEEIPIARWGQKGLLNQYGEIFMPTRLEQMSGLPLLAGPDESQARMMEQYQVLNQLLFPAGLRLEQLSLSDRNSWELGLNDGLMIVAGKKDVRERVKRLIDIYDTQIRNDISVIERIDLRYSNGFSVKKKPQDISEVAAR